MADNSYRKSYAYKGSDISLELRTNTGRVPVINGNGTTTFTGPYTHTLVGAKDNLTTLSFAAGATGGTITDSSLTSKNVSAITVNGGDKIYCDKFTKPVASNTLTFIGDTPLTVTSGDAIVVYWLDDADADVVDDILEKDIASKWLAGATGLEAEIDAATNVNIYSLMRGLGATLE